MKYDYSVVRFVPDTFRAEFVNVGLIVGNPETGEWRTKRVSNAARARAIRNDAELSAVWDYLDRVDELVDAGEDDAAPTPATPGPGWLADEHHRLRNLVQLSRPRPVSADSVDDAMAFLWGRMIVDPANQTKATTHQARGALRRAYLGAEIDASLIHESCRARIGRQDVPLDFVIANGHVAQLAHAFTFRGSAPATTVQRLKAWSWTIRDVRDRGGWVVISTDEPQPQVVDSGVPIDVVYDAPVTSDGERALEEAVEVLENLDVTVRPVEDVALVARDAAERLKD